MVELPMGIYGLLQNGAILLLFAALADLMDGAVARAIRAESEFGANFDSLSDAVSFGVAPAVLLLRACELSPGTLRSFLGVCAGMIFAICGVLRLVRFNVKTQEAKLLKERGNAKLADEQKKHFTGLPIPAGALTAVGSLLFLFSDLFKEMFPQWVVYHDYIAMGAFVVLAYLMICRWKFPSVKALHFKMPSFPMVFLSVALALFILYGVQFFFPLVLASLTWLYVIVGVVIAVARTIAGKKSKTLIEFEPDQEENENE